MDTELQNLPLPPILSLPPKPFPPIPLTSPPHTVIWCPLHPLPAEQGSRGGVNGAVQGRESHTSGVGGNGEDGTGRTMLRGWRGEWVRMGEEKACTLGMKG